MCRGTVRDPRRESCYSRAVDPLESTFMPYCVDTMMSYLFLAMQWDACRKIISCAFSTRSRRSDLCYQWSHQKPMSEANRSRGHTPDIRAYQKHTKPSVVILQRQAETCKDACLDRAYLSNRAVSYSHTQRAARGMLLFVLKVEQHIKGYPSVHEAQDLQLPSR